ncbi:hypothetical protein C2G38_2227530 [Gigaspora rosea]|uniref:Uncharacterized protein n=1 Tax=Gigaspora rosea TaxID=44941 RepID=A0A397TWZ1_9GLOM|nr:hypothetical protein C2G38_2227530 [Gigaspora rosea]
MCGIPKFLVRSVVWNLVATYLGEVDEDFWGRIVRIDEVFDSGGGTYISGWLMNFFPYCRDHKVEIEDIPNEILENSDNESIVSPVIGWSIVNDIKNP